MPEKLGNRRVTGLEQYYTPPTLADNLTRVAFEVIPDAKDRYFLEPAGGTGSFIDALKQQGAKHIISVDTHPLHPDVKKQNFLNFKTKEKNLVTLSNPPFGRNNALSIPFFNHAAKISSHIAFLVPRSWRKWSVQNRLDLNFHLIHDQDVDLIYIDADGNPLAKSNELRTAFQIWERTENKRTKVQVPDNGLIKKASPADADVALRVFGFGCGQVYTEFPRVPNTTMMFLKLSQAVTASLLEELDFDRFKLNTAYTQALSIQEINFLLNERIYGDGLIQK